jgi:hypothetical protein
MGMVDNRIQSWVVEDHTLRVDCADAVLEKISTATRNGFRQFRHGGMEVGGILLGLRRGSVVHVVDARPMEIGYGRGAFFLLTDPEHEALDILVQQTNQRVNLQGLRVIGYYESHTRRGVSLAETDLETFDAHFSGPLQICLIQKPEKDNVITTAVYIRDENSNIREATFAGYADAAPVIDHPVSAYVEELTPQPLAAARVAAPSDFIAQFPSIQPEPQLVEPSDFKTASANIEPEPPRAVIPETPEWVPPRRLYTLEPPRSRKRWLYAAAAAALAAIAAAMWAPRGPSVPPAASTVAAPVQTTLPTGTPPASAASPDAPGPQEVAAKPAATAKATGKSKRGKQARSRRARARSNTR